MTGAGQDLEVITVAGCAPRSPRTDADGRFRLEGLGPDRQVDLLISGPTIATTVVAVMTRIEPEIRGTSRGPDAPPPLVVHAPRFEVAVAPGRAIEGIARDKDTGRPIAGLAIRGNVIGGPYAMHRAEGVRASTDAAGRYRLEGLPRAAGYRLFVAGGPGSGYTEGSFEASANPTAAGPVAFDFALKRGVRVLGKVVDRATGRPIRGVVFFMALADNPRVAETPGYAAFLDLQSARIGDDGRYEIAALPGPGLLAVMDRERRHLPASGLAGMKGYDAEMNGFVTSFAPIPANGYNTFVATDFDPKLESASVDIALDPGRTVRVDVLDDGGRPLGGTRVIGSNVGPWSDPNEPTASSFEVFGLDPGRPRRVTVTHQGGKLAGSVLIRDQAGPITLKLAPWGTVLGRVVDAEGRPRRNIRVMGIDQLGRPAAKPDEEGVLPLPPFGAIMQLGDDGRFRFEGLIPGLKYGGYALEMTQGDGDLFRDVVVGPGEVRDLGDVRVLPDRPRGK